MNELKIAYEAERLIALSNKKLPIHEQKWSHSKLKRIVKETKQTEFNYDEFIKDYLKAM